MDLHFDVASKLGKNIRITSEHWKRIVETKHRIIDGKESLVTEALKNPDQIRKSKKDAQVFLHYKKINGKHACVVARHLNGDGFIITAYITDRIKAGDAI